jgi:N-acetylglutamate synthase/N-acetylornithine aminotransferase
MRSIRPYPLDSYWNSPCPSICPLPIPPRLRSVAGVELGIASAGIKKPGRKRCSGDHVWPADSEVVGVFTQNRFCAAPVTVCKEHLHAESGMSARWW